MRIWYQYPGPVSPFRQEVVFGSVRAVVDRVRRPDTEIEIVPTQRGAVAWSQWPTRYSQNLSNQEIIDSISQAGDGGYDGAIIGVSSDAGLAEAKELLPIPVVGLTEAACHLATLWGEQFAVITNPSSGSAAAHIKGQQNRRAQLERYNVLQRCVAIAPMEMPQDRFLDQLGRREHDEILTTFERMARRLVEEEGAEVIVAGDTVLAMALVEHNLLTIPGTGAVVVDLISSAIKLTEALVDIHQAFGIVRSRAGTYAGAPPEVIATVRQTFGITLPRDRPSQQ
ncbi:MAG: aspartate/glutamate racemase family protein [Dehalococcoidia bacterium]